jgi:uncharacterized membrane protein YpjA
MHVTNFHMLQLEVNFHMLQLEVSNGWVWVGNKWVGFLKTQLPIYVNLTKYVWPISNPTQPIYPIILCM